MTSARRIRKNDFFRNLKQSQRYREERAHATKRKEKCGNTNPVERGDIITPVIESLVANAGSYYIQLVRDFVDRASQSPEIVFLEPAIKDEAIKLIGDDVGSDLSNSISVLISGLPISDGRKLIAKCEDFFNTDDLLELTKRLNFLKDLTFIKSSGINLPHKAAVFIDKYLVNDTQYKGVVNETREMLCHCKDKSEVRGYIKYAFAPVEFKVLADMFHQDIDLGKDFFWRGRIIDYLSLRGKDRDLPHAC